MSAPVLPLVVGGRWELRSLLARGGLSHVYLAVDQVGGGEVAVKLGEPAGGDARRWQRFEREVAALALIGSEHVVRVLAAGREPALDAPYIVTELLVGDDLSCELLRRGGLPPAEVVTWCGQAAAALELAHGVGIVHRDLKPSNLFLHRRDDGERILKLLDFGLVRRFEGEKHVEDDAYAGTPHYMAPEQVRGHSARLGPAVDIWGMGMVAVAMLTGTTYWHAETVEEALRAIVSQPLHPPSRRWPWLGRAFDEWFARSCDRVPERRFATAATQAAALARALEGLTATPALSAPPWELDRTVTQRTSLGLITAEEPPAALNARPLVGRDAERHELIARLLAPGALVTVTGAAGTGKTRLAESVAAELGETFPGGAWWVPLATRRAPSEVDDAIADSLRLKRDDLLPLVDQLAAALRDKRALVVLDNFEHVLPARATVAELRARCPGVSWLATSRAPLGLEDEQRFVLAPLEVPAAGAISVAEARQYSAVQLYVERARGAMPDFALDAANVNDVVSICRRFDGLPLAIELAAARLGTRVPERPAADDGLAMGAALRWSYDLLSAEERLLFRRVAVLPGGFTLAAARRLCAGGVADVEAAIAALEAGSLIHRAADEARWMMLETVREFGLDALAAAGEERLARVRALDEALALALAAEAGLRGPEQARWLAAVAAELDNLRAALAWALVCQPDAALKLATHLAWFWYLRGHYREGSAFMEAALARNPGAGAAALFAAGELAFLQCSYGRAAQMLEDSAAAARREGDARGMAAAEQLLGSIAREQGDYALAAARHERSRAAWVELGDRREEGRSENYLAFVDWLSGVDPTRAEERARRARALLGELADKEGVVWSSLNLGAAALARGEVAAAVEWFEDAFHESVAARYQEGIAWSLDMQGRCSLARAEWTRATAQLRASLNLHRRLGDLWRSASVLEALAVVAAETGDRARAAALLAGARAARRRIAAPVPAAERPLVERALAVLSPEERVLVVRGAELPLDEALAAALDDAEERASA